MGRPASENIIDSRSMREERGLVFTEKF